HEVPSETRDTKIVALRLKFNAFKKIKAVSKQKSEKGLVAESFDWDEESLSLRDEGTKTVEDFMAIDEDEPVI
nr:hypothetical protein [Tanacetum cinerariifolium]